jgi:hypothetical protein
MYTSLRNKVLFILFFLFASICFSQHVDVLLERYVDDFRFEAERRGINSEYHLKQIERILLVPLPKEFLGMYYTESKVIEINTIYYHDEFLMRWTLFHEIGHTVGFMHISPTHNSIMMPHQPDFWYFIGDKEWQIMLNEYFQKKPSEK